MIDQADGTVVLAQLQVAFLWESDDQGLSPRCILIEVVKVHIASTGKTG